MSDDHFATRSTVGPLVLYDAACRALAEAKAVDEVKDILDVAVAMRAYAKQAKNRDLEADAVELRMRATRRLDQMRQAQKDSVGLNRGLAGSEVTGFSKNPVKDSRPTLAMQGINKNLAHQARVLGAVSDEQFEAVVADARDKVSRAVRNAVREVEILQERESYAGRTYEGGTVDDLEALAASGFRAGVICPDFPWEYETYSGKGKQRSAERHYDTWPLERILNFAPLLTKLAAPNCALLLWSVCPQDPADVRKVIEACGFKYKTVGLFWLKTTKNAQLITLDGKGLDWGMGYATRANIEPCLLAIRGDPPLRLAADVHQVVIAPVGEHSEKPGEVYRRIERLYPGPYLELFARRERPGWTVWGDEIPRTQPFEAAPPPDLVVADDLAACAGRAAP
jgi:N6-adenosine-specific RNA methylase IME4